MSLALKFVYIQIILLFVYSPKSELSTFGLNWSGESVALKSFYKNWVTWNPWLKSREVGEKHIVLP